MRFKFLLIIMAISLNSLIGQTWTNIFPNPSEFSYRGMYMDTTGLGIFVGSETIITKTTDFGATFTNVYFQTWGGLNSIERISDSIFIAIGSDAIMRSTDSGDNWVDLELDFDEYMKAVNFVDENRGYIVGSEGLVLMSEDGGLSWDRIHLNDTSSFTQVKFINDSVGYISGTDAGYFKTSDRGDTWEEIVLEFEDQINYLHFTDEENGLLFLGNTVFKSMLYRTADGGETWSLMNDNVPSLRSLNFLNDSIGFGANLIGRFFRTEDGGENWLRVLDSGLGHYNGFCIVNEDLIISATEQESILYSNDQGENWESLSKFINEDLTKVIFSDNHDVYVTGEDGLILKSIDEGLNFTKLNPGSQVRWNDIITSGDNTVMVVGDSSTIAKSDDGGKTWQQTVFDVGNFISISQSNNKIWLISDLGDLLISTDGGSTWTESLISIPSSPRFVYFISETTGFIIHDNSKVSRTVNGGESWEVIEEINYVQFNCLYFINDKIGYVAGDRVYKTLDGGETWEMLTSNLPVQDLLSIYFRDENIGYISGFFGLLMKTIDGGKTWEYSSAFTNQSLVSLKFNSQGVGIAVGLNGTILRIEEGDIINNTTYLSQEISSLKIHPNPANDEIFINSDLISDQSLFEIFDLNGNRLFDFEGLHNSQFISINHIPAGIYFLTHKIGSISENGIFIKQ